MDKETVAFLIRAKKAAYAGKGAETEPSRPNSHDLRYGEGELTYIDSYLGSGRFAGEEAVFRGGAPFWAMNYAGRVVGDGFSGDFLKEALSRVPEAEPFRGPQVYESGAYRYTCAAEGDTGWFNGYEAIYRDGVKIYECAFHGGDIV